MKYRSFYPANWEALAWACKERAGWRCEFCGVSHGAQTVSQRTGVIYTVYLGAAHVNHDPWNPAPLLIALCPSCHGRYDWSWHERERRAALEAYRHLLLLQAQFVKLYQE